VELRCSTKMHGLIEEGCIEVRCRSKLCGAQSGVVIIHRFSIDSGELVDTRKFLTPSRRVKDDDHRHSRDPLRVAGG